MQRLILLCLMLAPLLTPLVLLPWLLCNDHPTTHASSGIHQHPVWPIPDDPAEARKAKLINKLLPLIQQNNQALLQQRNKATRLASEISQGQFLKQKDKAWLINTGNHYRLTEIERIDTQWMTLLLRRLDIIPADLALAQAALESAWGESRFSKEGNNYFGQWCFKENCGLIPTKRPAGATYEVEKFSSPTESVRRYMSNLNSHPRYTQLRLLREQARQQKGDINGQKLAAGLQGYSTIGDTYIRTLRALIRANSFQHFNNI